MITRIKNFLGIAPLLFVLVTAGCQSNGGDAASEAGFQDLTVAEFKQKMESDDVVVLDVRTPGETAEGMIEGAQEIDFRADDFKQQIAALDKDQTYLVYCRSGGRSASACGMMEEMGFTRLYNLVGGYTAWSKDE